MCITNYLLMLKSSQFALEWTRCNFSKIMTLALTYICGKINIHTNMLAVSSYKPLLSVIRVSSGDIPNSVYKRIGNIWEI